MIFHTPSKFLSHPARSRHLWRLKLLKDSEFVALQCPFYNIRANACLMAASSGFYESHGPTPLGDACGIVPVHRHDHRNGQQSGHMLHRGFVFCHPGGHWGDTEWLVTQWRCLVAFMKALNLLHQAMCTVSHHRTAMDIKMASDRGTFVCCCRLFCLIKCSFKTMLWSI